MTTHNIETRFVQFPFGLYIPWEDNDTTDGKESIEDSLVFQIDIENPPPKSIIKPPALGMICIEEKDGPEAMLIPVSLCILIGKKSSIIQGKGFRQKPADRGRH